MKFGRARKARNCASARADSVIHPRLVSRRFRFPRRRPNRNPPEWTTTRILEFPGATDGPWSRFVADPDERRIGTVRYPRVEPRDDECAKRLAKRTLTNLYNERPAWLAHAHARLDAAVATAYGFDPELTDEQILEKLLALNVERAKDETKSAAKQRTGKKISRMKSEHEMI